MNDIHAIILTKNEEQHIERCIRSLAAQCASVTVVDCGSVDSTVAIAEAFGAKVITNHWVNYATQMNFGIDALSARGGWILRIDADEVIDSDSRVTLREVVDSASAETAGLLVKRRIHFLGRRIRHGGIEPSWQLRIWRNGLGRCEQRWMDEHITVLGQVTKTRLVLADKNLNSVTWWTEKHNGYASREAIDTLNRRYRFLGVEPRSELNTSFQAAVRRFLKEHVYLRIPSGLRAIAYYLYRYFFRLGFLDGQAGFYYHFLQAFWYRTLVDAKQQEILAEVNAGRRDLLGAIKHCTGIDPVVSAPSLQDSPPGRSPEAEANSRGGR